MAYKFYGKIKNGNWNLTRWTVFHAFAKGQPDGDYYIELHRAKGPPKTLQQLGYYYAVVLPTAYRAMVELGNDTMTIAIGGGVKEVPLSQDVVDSILKQVWATRKGCEVKSKAKFSIEEASELIDWSIQWCARYLGCVIPSPPDKDTVIPRKEARMA